MQRCILTDAQVHQLSCAVLGQAIQDWRRIELGNALPRIYKDLYVSKDELTGFFTSQYCDLMLSNSSHVGEEIVRWLKTEGYHNAMRRINKRSKRQNDKRKKRGEG